MRSVIFRALTFLVPRASNSLQKGARLRQRYRRTCWLKFQLSWRAGRMGGQAAVADNIVLMADRE